MVTRFYAALIFLALASIANAGWCLHPDGRLNDVGASPCDGNSVTVDSTDPNAGPGVPLTYDAPHRMAVPWAAEIQRRAASSSAATQDRTACADWSGGKAALDTIDTDVTTSATLTAAQLTSATVQKQLWQDLGRISRILRVAGRCISRDAGGDPNAPGN